MRIPTIVLLGACIGAPHAAAAAPYSAAAPVSSQNGRLPAAKKPPEAPRKDTDGELVVTGKILLVRGVKGGEPQLTDRKGDRYLLTGEWRVELLRLSGHTVKVWARLGKKKLMQRTLVVRRYEIIDAGGGHKPLVGDLYQVHRTKQLVLRQGTGDVPIEAAPALQQHLRRRLGCKVWIVGELVSGVLHAGKYGWLRCKKTSIRPKKEIPR